MAKCTRVHSEWKNCLTEEKNWKILILNKFGSGVPGFFEPYVKEGTLSWIEVFQFPTLASFFCEIFSIEWDGHKFKSENPNYDNFEWHTSPFAAYGDLRLSIINSTDVKVRKGEDESFILKGEEDKRLSHLAAEGDFVFALRQDSTIIRWNIQTKQSREVKRIDMPEGTFKSFVVKEGLIIVVTPPKIEIISYRDPEMKINVENKKDLFHVHKVLKNQNKIYFAEHNNIHILDLSTGKFSVLKCDMPDSNYINCIALDKDTLFVADTCHSVNRQILVYDHHGKIKQKLPIDLDQHIESMIVKKDLILGFYKQEVSLPQNQVKYIHSLVILDLNTGKTLTKILGIPGQFSGILDEEKQRVKPESLKSIFNFLKKHKEKAPSTYSSCLIQ